MSKEKQSPAVYPANVYDGDSQNRQQIATILQSMGFETDDISAAFNIFEKSYGDKKYDISVLTEIVFQVQSDPNNKLIELEPAQSHSAPNSPQIKVHSANIHQKHNPYYQQPPSPPQASYPSLPKKQQQPPRYNNQHAQSLPHQQPSTNDISSIFNSLSVSSDQTNHNQSRLKHGKALSASPQLKPNYHRHGHGHNQHQQILNKPKFAIPDESKMNLISCLESFDKYASDENEIIDVLLQTISNNDDFNNLVNWNDLYQNIKQRKNEWNQFQSQFDASIILQNYDENKHKQIKQNLSNHKSKKKQMKKNKNNKNETPKTPQKKGDSDNEEEKKQSHHDMNDDKNKTKLQRALQYELDSKTYDLLTKKDKLLVTANTYSILKNNKEKTELMISKCNEKMEEINRKILELQNEKKQYFSALMRTKNKLSFQIQSIRETEISIKELHEETNKIQIEIESIEKTKNCVNKFESQLSEIDNVLKSNFNTYLEPTWSSWNNREVIIWTNHIENEKYKTNINFLSSIQESNLCGKDLPHMNDFILRSFKMDMKSDRDLLLKNIKRVIQLKPKPLNQQRGNNQMNNNMKKVNRKNSDNTKKQLCVVCSDGEANHIMIPCGHIAVCSNCVNQVKQYKKCAFCGNGITNVIKCFHVGI